MLTLRTHDLFFFVLAWKSEFAHAVLLLLQFSESVQKLRLYKYARLATMSELFSIAAALTLLGSLVTLKRCPLVTEWLCLHLVCWCLKVLPLCLWYLTFSFTSQVCTPLSSVPWLIPFSQWMWHYWPVAHYKSPVAPSIVQSIISKQPVVHHRPTSSFDYFFLCV